MKAAALLLLSLLLAPPLSYADTLFQVVSLDCKYCAQFAAEGAVERAARLADSKDIDFKIGAIGPFDQASQTVVPEPPVLVFWAAVSVAPARSIAITETLYSYYAEARETGAEPGKASLLDDLAIRLQVGPDEVDARLNGDLKQLVGMWSKTARLLQAGMIRTGADQMNTPAFVRVDTEGNVTGYAEWEGSVLDTERAVRKLLGDS